MARLATGMRSDPIPPSLNTQIDDAISMQQWDRVRALMAQRTIEDGFVNAFAPISMIKSEDDKDSLTVAMVEASDPRMLQSYWKQSCEWNRVGVVTSLMEKTGVDPTVNESEALRLAIRREWIDLAKVLYGRSAPHRVADYFHSLRQWDALDALLLISIDQHDGLQTLWLERQGERLPRTTLVDREDRGLRARLDNPEMERSTRPRARP